MTTPFIDRIEVTHAAMARPPIHVLDGTGTEWAAVRGELDTSLRVAAQRTAH